MVGYPCWRYNKGPTEQTVTSRYSIDPFLQPFLKSVHRDQEPRWREFSENKENREPSTIDVLEQSVL